MENHNQGIILVALVITIVVLLILAGVSLDLVIENNGLITKAQAAKDKTAQAARNDPISIDNLYDEIDKQVPPNKVAVGEKATLKSTINGNFASAMNPIIPEGYIAINTDTTSWGDGTRSPTEDSVNKGLVITDSLDTSGNSNGNEWVWVPVSDASVMYSTEGATLTNKNWYYLYGQCKGLTASDKLISRMIWGNYNGTSVKASTEGRRLDTGITTFTRANNIYDIAGNAWEWTQEAVMDIYRTYRGGAYRRYGDEYAASSVAGGSVPDFHYYDEGGSGSHFNSATLSSCIKILPQILLT